MSVPLPIATGHIKNNNEHFIVMDYLNFTTLSSSAAAELGRQLADMHMCNLKEECSLVYLYDFFSSCVFFNLNTSIES